MGRERHWTDIVAKEDALVAEVRALIHAENTKAAAQQETAAQVQARAVVDDLKQVRVSETYRELQACLLADDLKQMRLHVTDLQKLAEIDQLIDGLTKKFDLAGADSARGAQILAVEYRRQAAAVVFELEGLMGALTDRYLLDAVGQLVGQLRFTYSITSEAVKPPLQETLQYALQSAQATKDKARIVVKRLESLRDRTDDSELRTTLDQTASRLAAQFDTARSGQTVYVRRKA